jgi:hypothetical protein
MRDFVSQNSVEFMRSEFVDETSRNHDPRCDHADNAVAITDQDAASERPSST